MTEPKLSSNRADFNVIGVCTQAKELEAVCNQVTIATARTIPVYVAAASSRSSFEATIFPDRQLAKSKRAYQVAKIIGIPQQCL